MPLDKSKYNKEYYKDKKPVLDGDKMRKYRDNIGGYRTKAQIRARVNYLIKALGKSRKTVEFAGTEESAYTLSEISQKVGRNRDTLKRWIKNKLIPASLYENKLYTNSQVLYIGALIKCIDTGLLVTQEQVSNILNSVWTKKFSLVLLNKAISKEA